MMKKIMLSIILLFIGLSAFSQDTTSLDRDEHLLDGMSFTYQYQSGGAIDISFTDGQLTYEWIAGRNAGKPAKSAGTDRYGRTDR